MVYTLYSMLEGGKDRKKKDFKKLEIKVLLPGSWYFFA